MMTDGLPVEYCATAVCAQRQQLQLQPHDTQRGALTLGQRGSAHTRGVHCPGKAILPLDFELQEVTEGVAQAAG
jgi:hypothetical protein